MSFDVVHESRFFIPFAKGFIACTVAENRA